MAKRVLNTQKAKINLTNEADKNTVWQIVGNAAIDYIEPKANDEWFTLEEVANYIISNGKAGIIASEKVNEVLNDMFTLFVGNHILLVNDQQEYRKFTIEETPFGKGGIVIERAKNEKKPIDI